MRVVASGDAPGVTLQVALAPLPPLLSGEDAGNPLAAVTSASGGAALALRAGWAAAAGVPLANVFILALYASATGAVTQFDFAYPINAGGSSSAAGGRLRRLQGGSSGSGSAVLSAATASPAPPGGGATVTYALPGGAFAMSNLQPVPDPARPSLIAGLCVVTDSGDAAAALVAAAQAPGASGARAPAAARRWAPLPLPALWLPW